MGLLCEGFFSGMLMRFILFSLLLFGMQILIVGCATSHAGSGYKESEYNDWYGQDKALHCSGNKLYGKPECQ